jgi:hypothetical protein
MKHRRFALLPDDAPRIALEHAKTLAAQMHLPARNISLRSMHRIMVPAYEVDLFTRQGINVLYAIYTKKFTVLD